MGTVKLVPGKPSFGSPIGGPERGPHQLRRHQCPNLHKGAPLAVSSTVTVPFKPGHWHDPHTNVRPHAVVAPAAPCRRLPGRTGGDARIDTDRGAGRGR